ncbi:efflux RND transporter periplasmic adaptor subunit [Thiolapillus brandeum]|uniref:RND family efflux transporter MFP subunit n=1 Tax=Thiolapillus brandeum TaxID=1076588 RepID=A0A7U6GL53_9GAMM|nr:efflux RND transporter periplasmic adaptor subunit [Thiolapillus brandeum]BAO45634.1 RND family efflux transporter MFP subunit [Thiolapillus brandeum]
MRQRWPKIILFTLVVGGIIAMVMFWLMRPRPVPVRVTEVDRGQVQNSVANTRAGTIKACRRSGLSPSIGGQIVHMPVREGDRVKKGQVLLEFWNDDLTAQLVLARRKTRAAEARARQACVQAETALRESRRLQELHKQRLASAEATDKAVGETRAAQAACDAARVNVEVSQAQIDVARAALDRTRLVAPFDGIAAQVNGEIGEFVTPSPVGVPTPPAVDLIDDSCIYVSAPMDEVDAARIRVDMPVRISLDAFADKVFPGRVRRIAPYVLDREKQARTVEVEADFQDPEVTRNMLAGYSADLEIILAQKDDALRIPTEAVLEGNKVLVLGAENRLHEKPVETGLSNWKYTEVRSGLKAGQQVVLSVDRDGVKDGALVRIESREH